LAPAGLTAQSSRTPDTASGPALVFAARAADRANVLDTARADYEAAAVALPSVADWLRLRAAGVTADPALRAQDYAAVAGLTARARIPWTEAQARERTGDLAGAIVAYDSLGARGDALRARAALLASTTDTGGRAALCVDIERAATAHAATADARDAVDLADRACAPFTPERELLLARAAAAAGALARAASGFARADALTPLADTDLFTDGMLLGRLRRDVDAERMLDRVREPAALRHAAAYQRARLLVADGDKAGARRALSGLLATAPTDTIAASALMLVADLDGDDGDDAGARTAYLEVARRFGATTHGIHARFRAALLAFVAGDWRAAAREWDALVAAPVPHSDESIAARYWSGRAWAAAGDRAAAESRWRAVVSGEPLSYYAGLSGRRLSGSAPVPALRADTEPPPVGAAVDSALGRALLLGVLGMDVEARFEVDRVAREPAPSFDRMLAIGAALQRAGEASRAQSLGWRLLAHGDSARADARVYRLIYPLRFADTLITAARAAGLDPALVAAVVRQESGYMPRAVSAVGARGLMQVMPSIGHDLARARGIGPWDPALLDRPDVSLTLGTTHLATFLSQQHDVVVRGLAAYNAGPSRVALWAAKHGSDDPEVFVERIPFAETRDYVRNIMRTRDLYAAIYHLSP